MTRLFAGERMFLTPVLGPVERGLYRAAGVDERTEQHWATYALAMLAFNLAGLLLLYAMQRLQQFLPLNPQALPAVAPDLAFNTAVSFTTNTNWQSYAGESTMGYLVQMAGLTVHNFVSAATGIALALALVRGFTRASASGVGNFWADLVRCTLYLLLPLSILAALLLVWQGVPQNLDPYVTATTLEGAQQTIAQGPVASQEAIKMLGTNGGGFFNANSAHPYENPTPLANLLQMVVIFALGAALTNVFGRMVGDERQGWAILAAMGVLFLAGVVVTYWAEAGGNPLLTAARARPGGREHGGEGGPVRHRPLGPLRRDHDRGLLRRRQRHARQLHAVGRHDPADQHAAGRDHRRRRRRRPLRHAALRHRRHVRGRPDGRPDAGICRQEARGEGGQDDHARHPLPAALDPGLHRPGGGDRARASPASRTRARTASPRCSMPSPRAPATTAAPSPA